MIKRSLLQALVVVLSAACLFALNSYFEPHFDFKSFWGAGRALLEGKNPYDYSVLQSILFPRDTANFNYPLYIALLVVPLGLFDLETAKNIWLTASEILFVASIYLIIGRRPRSRDLILSALACAAFVPTLIALFDQQTSMFALFLLSLAFHGFRKGDHVLTGVALALSLIKPQTVALLLVVTLLQLHRRGIAAFAITFLAMLVIAFGLMPDWPLQWWANASWITREAGRAVPTIWGLSWSLTSAYWLGGVLLVGLLCTLLLDTDFTYVLTVGLFLPVYMKPYDLVLLIIPALSTPDRKLLVALVIASYVLLFLVAYLGMVGDVFILLTVITLVYLLYLHRASIRQRTTHYRSLIGDRLRS